MTKNLFYIYFALFFVFVGYSLTLPLFPFYVERLSSEYPLSRDTVSIQVGIITAIYAIIQVIVPLFGRLSDRIGKKPILTIGQIGTAISIFIFVISTNPILLYLSRKFGGIFFAAIIPVISAYLFDLSTVGK